MMAGTVAVRKPAGLSLIGGITIKAYKEAARTTQIGSAIVSLPAVFTAGTDGESGEWAMAVPVSDLPPENTAYFTVSVEDETNTYTDSAWDTGTIPDKGISGVTLPINIYGISVTPPTNGALAIVPAGLPAALAGETITLKASANTGYTLMTGFPKVYKTDDNLTTVPVTGEEPDFSFTMPDYDLTVEADIRSSVKAITNFRIYSPVYVIGTIDDAAKTVTINVPYGTDVTNMETSVSHTGASINPGQYEMVDFTSPVTYTVTAADGTTAGYTVTVNVATLSSISLYSQPTNVLYSVGDAALNSAGLVIHGTDSLGTTGINIPLSEFTLTGFDTATRGSKTITATHTSSLNTSFTITVRNTIATLSSLAVKIGATEYPLAPAFDPTVGIYTVTVPYGTPSVTLEAALTANSYATFSAGGATQTITLSGDPGGVCGSGSVTVQAEDGLVTKTYAVTVSYGPGIDVSGTITFEDIPVITFSGGEVTVTAGEEIAITVDTPVTLPWYVDIDGATVTPNSSDADQVTFYAPNFWGTYTVNVMAEIGGVLYSGSFSLTVE
jgi:hypothetical protein